MIQITDAYIHVVRTWLRFATNPSIHESISYFIDTVATLSGTELISHTSVPVPYSE